MTKLNQIIAIETGVKSKTARSFTDCYHTIQKAPLLSGIARNYTPKDDDGDTLPPESTLVQVNAEQVLTDATQRLTRLFDVVLTKEIANTEARGDVVVDGTTVVASVPVTYLLFLEKQINDVRTLIARMPVLDPSEVWHRDETNGAWATDPTLTVKTKKVPRNWVKAEATDKHPAQVEIYHEDIAVGTWSTIKFSGALPATRITELLARADKLLEAIKFGREAANNMDIVDRTVGSDVFNYLLEV